MLLLVSIIINFWVAENANISKDYAGYSEKSQNIQSLEKEIPSFNEVLVSQTERTPKALEQISEFGISTSKSNQNARISLSNERINMFTDDNQIDYWKARFDMEWKRSKPFYTSQLITNGPEPNRYYDFRIIDALIAMLQATGDTKYMDNLIWYIDAVKNLASKSEDGYYDWPIKDIKYQLYDGHGLRNVFKLLWILKKYPDLRSKSNYQSKYEEWLPWFTINVWEKWESRGCNTILRSNTHMASHLGSNAALYLYLLENDNQKKAEYFSWLNAWNTDVNGKCRKAGTEGFGFRDQLRTTEYGGYIWANFWGEIERSTDVSHSNAEVQSVINQFHQDIEWSTNDIKKFIKTFNCILDSSPNPDYANLPEFLHSKYSSDGDNRPFITYGWTMLGRFDHQLHRRLNDMNTKQFKASHYYNTFIGNMTYNQAFLDELLVYPEF